MSVQFMCAQCVHTQNISINCVFKRAMVDAGSFKRAHLEPAAGRNERLYRHYVDLFTYSER
jgi:hypothetical protein